MLSGKLEEMEKTDPTSLKKPGFSNILTKLSMKKKENLAAQILATKFHTDPTGEIGSDEGIRINPIIKDLIINGYADKFHMKYVKKKRIK